MLSGMFVQRVLKTVCMLSGMFVQRVLNTVCMLSGMFVQRVLNMYVIWYVCVNFFHFACVCRFPIHVPLMKNSTRETFQPLEWFSIKRIPQPFILNTV